MPRKLSVFLCVLLVTVWTAAQSSPQQPLSRTELQELLSSGGSHRRIAQLVQQYGIDFEPADEYIKELQREGASDELVASVRAASPRARSAREHVLAGDNALSAGYLARAATEYARAWETDALQEEAGLKAARLWKHLGVAQSATILRALASGTRNPSISQEARLLLNQLMGTIKGMFDEQMANGADALRRKDPARALAAFLQATQLWPDRAEPHIQMSRVHASQRNREGLKSEVLLATKQDPALAEQILDYEEVQVLLADPSFQDFVNNVFGPYAIAKARQRREEAAAREREKTATIYGTFYGSDDNPAAGVEIILENLGTGVHLSTRSGSDGTYHFLYVPPGEGYKLTARRGDRVLDTRTLTFLYARDERVILPPLRERRSAR